MDRRKGRKTMATIIIKDAVTIEWSDVPQEVSKAIETLLYQIEENQDLDDGKSDVLGKIRAEIENHCGLAMENHCKYCSYCNCLMGVREILELIDKYKTESEE
jgi:hypothetical protein